MIKMICPDCFTKTDFNLSQRKLEGLKLKSYEHSVCDDCGKFLYMSATGLKYSQDMGFIMYHVERDQEREEKVTAAVQNYCEQLGKLNL